MHHTISITKSRILVVTPVSSLIFCLYLRNISIIDKHEGTFLYYFNNIFVN